MNANTLRLRGGPLSGRDFRIQQLLEPLLCLPSRRFILFSVANEGAAMNEIENRRYKETVRTPHPTRCVRVCSHARALCSWTRRRTSEGHGIRTGRRCRYSMRALMR